MFSYAPAYAQFTGHSGFALCDKDFPCDKYLSIVNFSPAPAITFVWGTWGEKGECACAAKFMQQNWWRPHLVQIHFSNENCRKHHICREGELYGSLSPSAYNRALENYDFFVYLAIQQRILDIRGWTDLHKNPNTTLMLSTGLEDQYSFRAYRQLSAYLHAPGHWPHIVNRNPLGGRPYVYGDFYEKHGLSARCRINGANIANEDGSDPDAEDSERFLRNNKDCFARFTWRKEHQGRSRASGRVNTPPRERRFVISDRDIRELQLLMMGD